MPHDTVGFLIREIRERRRYTQEELCYGICTPSTLSRIENGQQIPGKKILEGLLQRLGVVDRTGNMYLSREELETYELERQMERSLLKKDYVQTERLAGIMEQKINKIPEKKYMRKMEQQYLRFVRILVQKQKGERIAYILENLLDTIRMTIPDFDGIHIKTRLLTFHEIAILNEIGCTYHDMGKLWNGLQVLSELKEYMESHILDEDGMSEKYPVVLKDMSSWLEQHGFYEDALGLCQSGIDFCIEHGKLHTFPMLLYNKACALAELGQYDSSKEIFFQSVAVFLASNQQENAEQVKLYARRHYNIELENFFCMI